MGEVGSSRLTRGLWIAGIAWVLAMGIGFAAIWRYKTTPAAVVDSAPPRWPTDVALARTPGRATIVSPVSTPESLQSGELVIEPTGHAVDGSLVLTWKGRSTDRKPSAAILPFTTLWLERALHQRVPLRLDLAALDFMNSSTITAIIQIIQNARTNGVRLGICYDGAKPWQKLAFEALRVFETPDRQLELVALGGGPLS